jgi:hypothetical protein
MSLLFWEKMLAIYRDGSKKKNSVAGLFGSVYMNPNIWISLHGELYHTCGENSKISSVQIREEGKKS